MIRLPNISSIISKISIPLINAIVLAQIESIKFDNIELEEMYYSINSNSILIEIPSFSLEEHKVSIKDKIQSEILYYQIIIVEEPTFAFSQTLFLFHSLVKF